MKERDELTGRERVRLALRHQTADRVPIAMVCSGINPPALRDLEAFLSNERGLSVDRYLKPLVDVVDVAPLYRGPVLPARTDAWGVRRRPVSYGSGAYDEIEHYPLAGAATPADLASHRWPDPDWWDYGSLLDRITSARADGDPCLMIANGNLFETSWYMRGLEQMLVDAMVDEEMFAAIMTRVTDFTVGFFSRALAAANGEIDLVFTADDIGDQRGPILQPEKWRRLIVPHHQRLNGVIHEFGAKVIYHTDGSVMWALDGLVEMGIDVLQALQFSADGMDPVAMKHGWGDRLCFEGGVSVQTTLPFGSVEDVRAEVRERIDVLGAGGGYILGPSHWIQAGTPPANIAAMFDEAAAHRPPA